MALNNSSISSPISVRPRSGACSNAAVQTSISSSPSTIVGDILLEDIRHRRAELRATPGAHDVDRPFEATRTQVHLDDIGQTNDADFERNILSASAVRHPPAVPALEYVRQRLTDLRVQTHPVGEHSCRSAMRVDELGNLIARGEHEGGRADAAFPAPAFHARRD